MTAPSPGPAPDRAAAELARAEADWRATPPDLAGWVSLSRDASQALMAEYDRRGAELDRQRVIVRAAEALVDCDAAKPGLGQSISVWRRQRRELLDTLAAAVRAARPEGEER